MMVTGCLHVCTDEDMKVLFVSFPITALINKRSSICPAESARGLPFKEFSASSLVLCAVSNSYSFFVSLGSVLPAKSWQYRIHNKIFHNNEDHPLIANPYSGQTM
jgi:hypothetical protein